MIADIVGNDVMDNFQVTKMVDYIDLFREFEVKKRTFKNEMTSKINIKVPIALANDFKDAKKMELKAHIESKPKYKDCVEWKGDKIRMLPETAKGLFKEACDSASKHLREVFDLEKVKDVPTILMVGGFSESPLLQSIVKSSLPDKKVIIPEDAGLAVLKGAVIFGHDPSVIKERRCRYTYGVRTSLPFIKGVHPESKRYVDDDGDVLCVDMLDKHVGSDESVEYGKAQVTESYTVTKKNQSIMRFAVYASEDHNPTFVTEPGCTLLGSLDIQLSGSGMGRAVSVQMVFSGTELSVEAHEKKTGQKQKAQFEFLGNL